MQAINSDLAGLRWERNALKDLGVAQRTELKEEPELPFLGWAEIGGSRDPAIYPELWLSTRSSWSRSGGSVPCALWQSQP